LLTKNQHVTYTALLIAAGLIIFIFESFIPRPLPWIKPGLANVATLIALYLFNARAALIVAICRVILGSLVIGTFLNLTFILAFGGGIAAAMIMALFKECFPHAFSIFGISIIGAVAHNITQLFLATFLIVDQPRLLYLTPMMVLTAMLTGTIVAFVSHYLLINIKKHFLAF